MSEPEYLNEARRWLRYAREDSTAQDAEFSLKLAQEILEIISQDLKNHGL